MKKNKTKGKIIKSKEPEKEKKVYFNIGSGIGYTPRENKGPWDEDEIRMRSIIQVILK